jgi:DNA repair exonuclease SbcCD ATPase subunit
LTQRDLDGKAADRAALQASLATAKADLSQATKAGPTVDISRLEGELEAAMQRMETARVAWEAQVRESRQGSQAIQQAKARVSLLQSRVKDKEAKLHKAVVRLFGKDTGGQWDVRAMEAEKAKIDDEVRLSFQA